DDRAHRAADETELERRRDDRDALQRSGHHDQRVALVGVFLRLREALAVALRVLEFQRIERLDVRADLLGRIGVEEPAEPLAGADPKVMVALRANEEIALELGAVELSGTARALHPQAFRHRAPPLLGVDA